MATEKELLDVYLSTIVNKVKKNIEIIDQNVLGQNVLYHVSIDNKLGTMIPTIGFRQANDEDRTVPRVCVGATLLGCLLGHAAAGYYFENSVPDGKPSYNSDGIARRYYGGLKIYEIPFEYALKPNTSLVYDANVSNEYWLINYSKKSSTYKPAPIGDFFIHQLIKQGRNHKIPFETFVAYLELQKDMQFSKSKHLKAGFYKIVMYATKHVMHDDDLEFIKISKVSESEYKEKKGLSANLLEYQENKWLDWST
jgi:hypothetical protein